MLQVWSFVLLSMEIGLQNQTVNDGVAYSKI